jgi:hypothetical protein
MKINALFVTRKGDTDVPELVDAWDEYTIDENPDGYTDAIAKWRGYLNDGDVDAFTVVTLRVSAQAVLNALYPDPVVLNAEIVDGGGSGVVTQ